MAKCTFSLNFSNPADSLIAQASNAIKSGGGDFQGDTDNGSFNLSTPIGKVAGEYMISDGAIHITISEKPLLVSCNRIKEELSKRIL